ncbi:MAG: PcfJ domain-containing protein [Alphaproteobacteria bacterium]|nr:PcfJ domain-containing protein [Alphaproteobacteria bacterium]
MNLRGLTDRDVERIEKWLADIASDERLSLGQIALLRCSVGRIAANNIRSSFPQPLLQGHNSPYPRQSALRHIVDWLVSSSAEGAAWLTNVDEKGRPRKLLKCQTYADLVREADKAMDRKNAQMAKALGTDDERPVVNLASGFYLVQLITPAALDLESVRMHHCVGHGSYDEALLAGDIEMYSLRDRTGRPVLTIEIGLADPGSSETSEPLARHREIYQIQGKRNFEPDPKHLELLKEHARRADWKGRRAYWPYVTDVDGVEHYIEEIPAGTVLAKLGIPDTFSPSLPDNLTVQGDAYIGHRVTKLPENLDVGGNLMISTAEPLLLPESLRVAGRLKVWHEADVQRPIPAHLAEKFEIALGKPLKKMGGWAMAPHQWLDLFDDPDGIERADHDMMAGQGDDQPSPAP